METKRIIKVLQSAFLTLDYISDKCDEDNTDDAISSIRLNANGELAELEELIVELQKESK
jgi:hypothetical protein